jgi:hypothetical protein
VEAAVLLRLEVERVSLCLQAEAEAAAAALLHLEAEGVYLCLPGEEAAAVVVVVVVREPPQVQLPPAIAH